MTYSFGFNKILTLCEYFKSMGIFRRQFSPQKSIKFSRNSIYVMEHRKGSGLPWKRKALDSSWKPWTCETPSKAVSPSNSSLKTLMRKAGSTPNPQTERHGDTNNYTAITNKNRSETLICTQTTILSNMSERPQ